MKSLKDIKFKTKLRLSYILLGAVCTIVLANDLIQMFRINQIKEDIYAEYIAPSNRVDEIISEFETLNNTLLKFSIPSFESLFEKNLKLLTDKKAVVDSALADLNKTYEGTEIQNYLKTVNANWEEYKILVIDGTLSAAAIKDFDIAAEVATTSGEEIGEKLANDFKSVQNYLTVKGETLNAELTSIVTNSRIASIIGMSIGSLIFIFAFVKMTSQLIKPIEQLKSDISKFAIGDFEEKIEIRSKDEFGELAENLEKLRVAQYQKIEAANEISKGNLDLKINVLSEKDMLSKSFEVVVENLNNLIFELKLVTDEIINGKASTRGNPEKFYGAYKEIVIGVNATLDALFMPIQEGVEVLSDMSKGNFTARVKGEYKGDHRLIADSINTLGDSLVSILSNISEMVNLTASISEQISSSTEEMAAGAQEQSVQTFDVVSSVEEMTKTIVSASKNASQAAEASKKAGEVAREGGTVVEKTVNGMNRIAQFVEKASTNIQALGKNSEQIGEIVQVIDDIANQTNLLALNAAIEAARAGEQGRGFAVVADEVRKLAERTTKATKEISDMIKRIQNVTENVVHSMNEGSSDVQTGKELAQKAGLSLKEIISASDQVLDVVAQVASASEQQSATSEQISRNVESISKVTNESASGIQQIAGAADELNKMTTNLKSIITHFKFESAQQSKTLSAKKEVHIHS
ncbi:MAG: methyl-accepting chemotaxis protein [Ignavibacteriales bacterium]|nr:methyl-accepting chemotaxis protein [Ignavibacteriales bacterium]